MTSLPEQFSAAAGQSTAQVRAQFEAQFDFFHKVTNQALDSASRFATLNLAVSRDSVERSTRATQTLLASRDPRDLLVLRSHAEEQVRSLFDYSRELMGIASGVKLYAAALQAPVNVPASAPQLAARAVEAVDAVVNEPAPVPAVNVAETEVVVVAEPEPEPVSQAAAAHAEAAEPLVLVEAAPAAEPEAALAAEPAPVAEPTPIAIAAGKGEAQAGVAPHPAAAPVPQEGASVQVPKLASRRKNK